MSNNDQAIERANAYREMMQSWAWKDYCKILNTTRMDALEKAVVSKTMEEVQVQRGIVKAIDLITGEISFIMENT